LPLVCGARAGNHNALKHGRFTREAYARRANRKAFVREVSAAIAHSKVLVREAAAIAHQKKK
jgi:hypothetical protein